MGQSTDGQICFGVLLDEATDLPWDNDIDAGDLEMWWMRMQGYRPLFTLWDETGNYVNGVRPPEEKLKEYYDHKHAFEETHPVPFALVNYCSQNYPLYILAIASSERVANRGYPKSFNPADLNVSQDEINNLLKFCADHGIEYNNEPGWWLSSYWG